jgi:putative nucleotidyltransferase with HDIG domain
MNALVLDQVLRSIQRLPSLPSVVVELLASMERADVKIDSLASKIGQDQALTARVLRLANSSFYGMSQRITTIRSAIAILGFKSVRSLATSAALMNAFGANASHSLLFLPFWRHAIGTAVCAREIAPQRELDPDEAYAAGLLHDIGRLVLVTQFEAAYQATQRYHADQKCELLEAEQHVLGIDHAALGHAITKHWNFPAAIQQAVACHHAASCNDLSTLALVVMAANAMAHTLDFVPGQQNPASPVPAGLWRQLGLDEAKRLALMACSERRFEGETQVLNS